MRAVEETHDASGFLEVTVDVKAIRPVPRARTCFEQEPGDTVRVLISPDVVERLGVRPGCALEADVRRADLHRSFVHPERIAVLPPPDGTDAAEAAAPEADHAAETDPHEGHRS